MNPKSLIARASENYDECKIVKKHGRIIVKVIKRKEKENNDKK